MTGLDFLYRGYEGSGTGLTKATSGCGWSRGLGRGGGRTLGGEHGQGPARGGELFARTHLPQRPVATAVRLGVNANRSAMDIDHPVFRDALFRVERFLVADVIGQARFGALDHEPDVGRAGELVAGPAARDPDEIRRRLAVVEDDVGLDIHLELGASGRQDGPLVGETPDVSVQRTDGSQFVDLPVDQLRRSSNLSRAPLAPSRTYCATVTRVTVLMPANPSGRAFTN